VLGLSLRVALRWCDAVVVYLHACSDASPDIVEAIIRENDRGRVYVLWDKDPKWDEMSHRQQMLELARNAGATHIAIVDADEVLSTSLIGREYICSMPQGGMLQLPLYNLRGSIARYHADGIWGNRIVDLAFADNKAAQWAGDCFHARAPSGVQWQPYKPIAQGQGGIMHLWGCSERRLRAKCALYKVVERLRWPDRPAAVIERMYDWAIKGQEGHPSYGTPATWAYRDVPTEWWAPYASLMKYLDVDAEPWQEAEVRRLVIQHGAEMFAGLDLFGVL
jgi:hypothetical protein